MAKWIKDRASYEFQVDGRGARVQVTGVMDASENERPKLILADHAENKGTSVFDEAARNKCILSLSASMKIEPREADWFVQDRAGKLQSVSLSYSDKTVENPQFTAWKSSDDYSHLDEDGARRGFPDVKVSELKTSLREATPEQEGRLNKAFSEARDRVPAQQVATGQDHRSAQEYDLSQEML